MTDITKCSGEGCPVKTKCKRFSTVGSYYQTYFVESPLVVDQKGVVSCDMFWGENAENVFKNLQNIVGS